MNNRLVRMSRARVVIAALTVVGFGFGLHASVAGAASPTAVASASKTATPGTGTPTPPSQPTVAPTPVRVIVAWDEKSISWTPVPGAARYTLTGGLTAQETGPEGRCSPSAGHQIVKIKLDESLPGDATSFALTLPSLPADEHWTITVDLIELTPFNQKGIQLGGAHLMQIVEGCGFFPSQHVVLPSTGRPDRPGPIQADIRIAALFIVGVASFVSGAARFGSHPEALRHRRKSDQLV